jgi:pilus assembly protein Flp/PilA
MQLELRLLVNAVGKFLRRDAGVTAIEYGLLAALIAVAIIAALSATGDSLEGVFNYWSTAVVNAIGG